MGFQFTVDTFDTLPPELVRYIGGFLGPTVLVNVDYKYVSVGLQNAQDRWDGPVTVWYSNGVKRNQLEYRKGVFHGIWSTWHPNGRLSTEREYREGKPRGTERRWNQAGQLRFEYNHDNLKK